MKFTDILMAGQEENVRRAIESTMDTYQTPWKVVHETLQNSLDAIYNCNKEGNVSIIIDIKNQSVRVRDDGEGFPQDDEGRRLLGLHGSNKSNDNRLGGNLGYGIKAVICSTNYFRLISHKNNKSWGFEIFNGDDLENAEFTEISLGDEQFEENGTEIYYTFNNNLVSQFINDVYASTPGIARINSYDDTINFISRKGDYPALLSTLFQWHFRTSTYAANIDRLIHRENSKVPKVIITFKIICDNLPTREETNLTEEVYNVLSLVSRSNNSLDIHFENKYWDIEDFFLNEKGKTKPRLPFTIRNDVSLPIPDSQKLKKDQVVIFKLKTIDDFQRMIRYRSGKTVSARNENYYDGKVFNVLQGAYIVIGRKRHLDHLLLPSMPNRQSAFARGIPTQDFVGLLPGQGESVRSEFTIMFAPNVSDALNLGKLQLNFRKRIGWLREFYTDMFTAHLRRVSSDVATREDTHTEDIPFPDDEPSTEFVDRETIFEPGSENNSVIIKPLYENEVIALFFELIGKGIIDGYQFYGLSGYEKYDGKAEFKTRERDNFRRVNQDSKLITIEFKVMLSKLAQDLNMNKKSATKMHLVIVWDADEDNISNQADFRVVALEQFVDVSGRHFPDKKVLPHVETILAVLVEDIWVPIQVLELKTIVNRLNNGNIGNS